MAHKEVEELQAKIAWLEHHVEQQDKEILALARKLDSAIQQLQLLRKRLEDGDDAGGSDRLSQHERPPHY